jgi:hypothetical protein
MRGKLIAGIVITGLLAPLGALAQPGGPGSDYLPVDEALERSDRNIPKNSNGQLGALAPANLNAEWPDPPWNLTGTWFIDLVSKGFGDFRFGSEGYPEFIGQAAVDFEEGRRVAAEGGVYRDAIGQCFPAGLPMIMTRIWPIMMVQLPTVVYMTTNFNNSFRQIFLDGREYSDPDTVIYTYNGESIGHWEGDTLVVDTRYIETWNHYIDTGIPISDDFRVQERIRLVEDGRALEIETIMTDPNMWVGEWRKTNRWLRVDNTDIGEVECLPDLNDNIPSVQAGQLGLSN